MSLLVPIALADAATLVLWTVSVREGIGLFFGPQISTGMLPLEPGEPAPHRRSEVFELQKRGFTPLGRKWERLRFSLRQTLSVDLASPGERCFATLYGRVTKKDGAQGPAIYLFTAFEDGGLLLTWNTPRPLYDVPGHLESGVDTFDLDELLSVHRRRLETFAGRVVLPLTAEGRLEATRSYYRSQKAIVTMRGFGRRMIQRKLPLLAGLITGATVLTALLVRG